MKKTLKSSILLLCLFFGTTILANNEPVMVLKVIGNEKEAVYMYQAVDGPIELFFESTEVTEYGRNSENGFFAVATKRVNLFYIGTGKEVERINPGNYKRLIQKYLPNAPELHKRIGKRGFRFENLPSMVLYYNKHKTDNPTPLTKKEVARLFAA